MRIRKAFQSDRSRLYEICLLTGESGLDASGIYLDPDLLGDIWVGPYLVISPDHCFVVENDGGQALGYCIATPYTSLFEVEAERSWWPKIQARYPKPEISQQKNWSRDEKLVNLTFHPPKVDSEILHNFPSHAHINILPELQGKGWGKKLISTMESSLLQAGSPGVHLILSANNQNALAFYQAIGYQIYFQTNHEICVVKKL